MYNVRDIFRLLSSGEFLIESLILLVLSLCYLVLLALPLNKKLSNEKKGPKGHTDFKSMARVMLIFALIGATTIFFNFRISFFWFSTTVMLVVILMLITVLHKMSLRKLGANWTDSAVPSPKGQLITSGLYRYFRHPVYAMIFYQGVIMCLISPVTLFVGLFFIWIPIYRLLIRKEEDALIGVYGDEYHSYMKKTKYRIIPFVY